MRSLLKWGRDALIFIGLVVLGVFVATMHIPKAKAHSGYTEWMQPDTNPKKSCCSNVDCFPVQARYDDAKKRYYALIEGHWVEIPPNKILDPKLPENVNFDGSYHACWKQDGSREILCFREAEPKG